MFNASCEQGKVSYVVSSPGPPIRHNSTAPASSRYCWKGIESRMQYWQYHSLFYQYNFSNIISNNIEVYEEPGPQTKKINYREVKFEAHEENRICYESLYWLRCCTKQIQLGVMRIFFHFRYEYFSDLPLVFAGFITVRDLKTLVRAVPESL